LERAVRLRRPGEYQLQAAITALQIQAPDADATDWAQIAELFGALVRLNPSPVIELNRAEFLPVSGWSERLPPIATGGVRWGSMKAPSFEWAHRVSWRLFGAAN
jgi:hypothetical protein